MPWISFLRVDVRGCRVPGQPMRRFASDAYVERRLAGSLGRFACGLCDVLACLCSSLSWRPVSQGPRAPSEIRRVRALQRQKRVTTPKRVCFDGKEHFDGNDPRRAGREKPDRHCMRCLIPRWFPVRLPLCALTDSLREALASKLEAAKEACTSDKIPQSEWCCTR